MSSSLLASAGVANVVRSRRMPTASLMIQLCSLLSAFLWHCARAECRKLLLSAIQSASQIIANNKGNAACAVYTFGILQIVEGMPIFVSASNKSIISLRSSKEESIAQVGPESGSRWDDLITQAQVEFQKGLIYRGDVIGRYFSKVKSFCK